MSKIISFLSVLCDLWGSIFHVQLYLWIFMLVNMVTFIWKIICIYMLNISIDLRFKFLKLKIPYMTLCRYCFYPRPVLAFGYCRCLRLSVSPSVTKFICAITHYPLKLGSPNLDQRCKRPWLRSLCFVGRLTLTFKVKLNSKVKIYPIWACPCHNSQSIEVIISKFGTEMHLNTVQIPINFWLDWNWSPIEFSISNPDQIELFMYIIGIL